MKNYKDYKKDWWFTLVELLVSITIMAILLLVWNNFYKGILDDQRFDDERNKIQQLWNIFASIVSSNWDIPNWYCRKSNWTYDTSFNTCIGNLNYTGNCSWNYWDIQTNSDCEKWCIIINCKNWLCEWNNTFFDFTKLVNEKTNYKIDTSVLYKNLSYKICPLNNSWSLTIWKANWSLNTTFNPSFSLFHNWIEVFSFNSNP